jgi:hypothetical protein
MDQRVLRVHDTIKSDVSLVARDGFHWRVLRNQDVPLEVHGLRGAVVVGLESNVGAVRVTLKRRATDGQDRAFSFNRRLASPLPKRPQNETGHRNHGENEGENPVVREPSSEARDPAPRPLPSPLSSFGHGSGTVTFGMNGACGLIQPPHARRDARSSRRSVAQSSECSYRRSSRSPTPSHHRPASRRKRPRRHPHSLEPQGSLERSSWSVPGARLWAYPAAVDRHDDHRPRARARGPG